MILFRMAFGKLNTFISLQIYNFHHITNHSNAFIGCSGTRFLKTFNCTSDISGIIE